MVYLSPSYYPYRVPVFDHLYTRIGEGFAVLSNRTQAHPNSILPQTMGAFPRVILGGRHVSLSRHHDEGTETPFGITVTPSLAQTLAKLRPEVVISINFNLWTLTALLMNYPTIIFWEGTVHTERTVTKWRKEMRRWMVKRARAFVTNGALSRQYLVEQLGAPESSVFEGGMCAESPPETFMPVQPRSFQQGDTLRFLYLGRLIDRKGVKHLVKAAGLLKQRLKAAETASKFEVVMLGDGPERAALAELCRQLDVVEQVRFEGAVLPEDVWQYYANSHVLVLPTLQDNWPLVVPEAMSMGLPVFLSKYTGSVPDLLQEDENGYVFDPNDHEQLAALMQRYLEDPDLVQKQGGKSLELVAPYKPEATAGVFLKTLEFVASP